MNIDSVTLEYIEAHPRESAFVPLQLRQKLVFLLMGAAGLLLFLWRWDLFLYSFSLACAVIYLGIALFRSLAALRTVQSDPTIRVTERELSKIDNKSLPTVTILVPLYKEANIADKLIRSINKLDYPAKKLDIKLLLEEDDTQTQRAVRRLKLPGTYEVIVVPDSMPKTKPKACNHGLKRAKGEFCVIYDAEDRPERDQLKKMVLAFARVPKKVACLQARLNYFNARQNWLTRWFTIEYTTHFDLLLPGLQRMNVPIPLGGTSNHFRTSVLKELGGWDPFNVTEDCDLGVKVYKAGYETRMLESTTWEEANSDAWNWIRQRSRWVKGYFQTHFTHMRYSVQTFKALGLRGFIGFFLGVGGSALMMVLNLFFWAMALLYGTLLAVGMWQGASAWDLMAAEPAEQVLPYVTMIKGFEIRAWPLFYYGPAEDYFLTALSLGFFGIIILLTLTNLLFVATHVAACLYRGEKWLVPHALTMPLYWVMISIGAWKGLVQLFTNPFYWEKTNHGLDQGAYDEELEEELQGKNNEDLGRCLQQ